MKYPVVIQDGIKDCAVACISMIIKYYNGYIPMEKLRDMTKTTKKGTSAYNIVKTLNNIGIKSDGYKIENINTIENLPVIAFTTINKSYNHYVVIYEIDKEKKEILIADPAYGIKKMKFIDFEKIFNNIIISCSCYKRIPLYTKPQKFNKYICEIFSKYKLTFIKLIIISIFITFLSIITSTYIENIINKSKSLLSKIFIVYLVIYIIKNILDYFRNIILLKLSENMTLELTCDIFSKIISLPYEYFKNRTTGEVVSRLNDFNNVNKTILKLLLTFVLDFTLAFLSMIMLFLISYKLFLISLLIIIFYLIIVKIFKTKLIKKLEKIKQDESILNSYIVESITSFETIKGLNIEKNIINKYNIKLKKLLQNNTNYEYIKEKEFFLKNIIDEVGLCFLLFIGMILILKNELNIGKLLTFNTLLIYFVTPIKNLINLRKEVEEAKISYNRICELIIEENDKVKKINIKINNIKIKNLNYSYDNYKNIINDINLNINKNDKIMLLGKSGSGKSTILKLLKKYYKVKNNIILLNDIDINKISKNDINQNITYVAQNEILFTDTLYNNLTLNRKLNLNKITKIIEITKIDFIDKNFGLDMYIEENGINLSGGQRQRIILARALLNNFNVLILDESLNQVDVKLEREILKNIIREFEDKIIIFVSHRYDNKDLFKKCINITSPIE